MALSQHVRLAQQGGSVIGAITAECTALHDETRGHPTPLAECITSVSPFVRQLGDAGFDNTAGDETVVREASNQLTRGGPAARVLASEVPAIVGRPMPSGVVLVGDRLDSIIGECTAAVAQGSAAESSTTSALNGADTTGPRPASQYARCTEDLAGAIRAGMHPAFPDLPPGVGEKIYADVGQMMSANGKVLGLDFGEGSAPDAVANELAREECASMLSGPKPSASAISVAELMKKLTASGVCVGSCGGGQTAIDKCVTDLTAAARVWDDGNPLTVLGLPPGEEVGALNLFIYAGPSNKLSPTGVTPQRQCALLVTGQHD